MTGTAEPPTVSRFESNLLRLLRLVFGDLPTEQAAVLVNTRLPAPPCLGRTSVRLIEDTLAKGLVLHLVRAGGWRVDRFLHTGKPSEGRAWERWPLEARSLGLGEHSLSFLIWLTADRPTDATGPWDASPAELTPADELFLALAFDALRPIPDVSPSLAGKAAFHRNGLCWLLGLGEFATSEEPVPPDFTPWTTGSRAMMLECLQPMLAQRLIQSERAKGQIGDWKRMRQQGRAEFACLGAFLTAVEAAGRPDLARFILRAASTVLATPGELTPAFWTGGLQGHGPPRLADRLETQRAALALPRQVETLHDWDRRARSVGYFDEDYPASQLWKADWEAARGDETAARAREVVNQLEPLRTK